VQITEWVLHPREFDHVECGGVYIYDSVVVFWHVTCVCISKIFSCVPLLRPDAIYLNANIGAKKIETEIELTSNSLSKIESRGKNHNRHITITSII